MASANCSSLLINVDDLLRLQGVEKQRVEFKKAWHGKKEGGTYWQVIHTICAFANDFYNDNGGYIIIGVEEKGNGENEGDGRQIILPPLGVPGRDLDTIQKEIMGACSANIYPPYSPILSPEVVELEGTRKHVLVIWAMASDNRPHTCRESEKGKNLYYIRRATETKKASRDEEYQLLSLHSKIPFDDRRAVDHGSGKQLSEEDIDFELVQAFLKGVRSRLLDEQQEKMPIFYYERLKLVTIIGHKGKGERLVPVFSPRNVALLFFHPRPHDYFSGAITEIAIYTHENETEEKVMTGPIDKQIQDTLSFILKTTKEEARHEFVAYPTRALREAVVNAFHHRGYEGCDNSPIKIHIKPNCIDVISYPGPNPNLKPEHFSEGNEVPCVPSRNRRIAELLKERKLAEGRSTGIGTIYRSMKKNNSPKPSFDFDQSRFCVRLPGHPKYIAYSIKREVDKLNAKGDKHDAIKLLKEFLDEQLKDKPSFIGLEMLISKLLDLLDNDMKHPIMKPYEHIISQKLRRLIPLTKELCIWCDSKKPQDISTGVKIVKKLVKEGARYEDLDSAVRKAVELYKKKSDDWQQELASAQHAHKLFEAMGELTQANGYVAYHFACCKFNLYILTAKTRQKRKDLQSYLKEAEDYVNKAILLTNEESKLHLASQYRQLGYIHSQLLIINKSTVEEVIGFYEKARKYIPRIDINQVYIPAEYKPKFRQLRRPESVDLDLWGLLEASDLNAA